MDAEALYGALTIIIIAITMIALEDLMEILLPLQIKEILKFEMKNMELINFTKKIFWGQA